MLRSSPRDQREAREEELERLERAFKRAESLVNRDKKEGIESQALEQVRKQEKERRKEGKSNWYLKKCKTEHFLPKYMLSHCSCSREEGIAAQSSA